MWQDILKVKATATHNSKGEKKDRCAKLADKKYGMKSSAYKSGFIVRCRQGKVKKADPHTKKERKGGLHAWFNRRGGKQKKGEKSQGGWIACGTCGNKSGPKPCGREDASKGKKRKCRPTCGACKGDD